MDADVEPGDVFAIPNLWAPAPYIRDVQESSSLLFPGLRFDDINEKLTPRLPPPQIDDGFFGLPDLSFGILGDVPTPSSSTESSNIEVGSIKGEAQEEEEEEEETEEEVWMDLKDEPLKEPKYISWDSFEDHTYEEPYTSYVTEAGPGIFDALLADELDVLHIGNAKHLVVKTHIYAASLLALGLGRSSVLFTWNDEKKSFVKAIDPIRIPGCTGEVIDGLLTMFMNCGNVTRALESFVDTTYRTHKSPGRIAMADAISTLLFTLEIRLGVLTVSLTSFLQLQALFKPVEALLTSFHLMVQSVASIESDEAMLSQLFHEVQRLEHRTDSMRNIVLEVLARVSRPFLDFMGEWMGTQKEAGVPLEKRGPGRSFVRVEDRVWIDEQGLEMRESDFIMDADLVPSFIPVEDARKMFETGRSLRFIRAHHSNHPLAQQDVVLSAMPPTLEWKYSWQNIEQIEARALQYEKDLVVAIKRYSSGSLNTESRSAERGGDIFGHHPDVFSMPKVELEAHLLKSIAMLNEPPSVAEITNPLSKLLKNSLAINSAAAENEEATLAPPISLTPILSFGPIIAAQARIVNGASLRLFFQAHGLREHLRIQRRFQLLGDGVFSSRLSHALFDPELETAECKAGVSRSGGIMGLRLGGCDNWPPASSELRLALMGVLTESYASTASGGREHVGGYLDRKNELPGDLSFAVRDMSEEEIEKCKDPNAVEALDFLRLSYKPPPPLEVIITPMSLYKYDQVFKLLLRLRRMLFVVSQLFRDALDRTLSWQGIDKIAQRFRIEAHHFVSCISGYFFDTGIDTAWRILERKLDQIEERIKHDADPALWGQNEGLDRLQEYHERILDRIMFSLLLRKRQQPVMKLMEDIFTLILHFAKDSGSHAAGIAKEGVGRDQEVKEMYLKFRRKVEIFITVCRGLGEKKGYGETRTAEPKGMLGSELFNGGELTEDNSIVQLLARLEVSNYYSQPVNI